MVARRLKTATNKEAGMVARTLKVLIKRQEWW